MGPRRTCRGLQPCVALGELKYEPVVFCNPELHSVNRSCFRGTFRLRTGNQPIRFHLLASGVGRESVASSCRTFAKGILHTTARVSDPASSSMPAAPPSRRSCRCYRGSLPSLAPRSRLHDRLVIAALPRPAASLGAALGRGPDFCGSYLVCLLALAVPAGWIPRLR